MSIYDEFRALTAELFDAFDAPNATITGKVTPAATNANRAMGTNPVATASTSTVRVIFGKRKIKAADGVIHIVNEAKLSGPAKVGDRLTVGANSYTITSVDEINPDGGAPMLYIAGLK